MWPWLAVALQLVAWSALSACQDGEAHGAADAGRGDAGPGSAPSGETYAPPPPPMTDGTGPGGSPEVDEPGEEPPPRPSGSASARPKVEGKPGTGMGYTKLEALSAAVISALDSRDPAKLKALFPSDALLDQWIKCTGEHKLKARVHERLGRLLQKMATSDRHYLLAQATEEHPEKRKQDKSGKKDGTCTYRADIDTTHVKFKYQTARNADGCTASATNPKCKWSDRSYSAEIIIVGGRFFLLEWKT